MINLDQKHSQCAVAGLALVVIASSTVVLADDAAIAWGGTPAALNGHPTVCMRSETVRMTVGKTMVKVDCTFDFENTGKARRVRMGFPDEGAGAYETGAEEDAGAGKPPSSNFTSFASYVDGSRVATRLVKGSGLAHYWHVKTVDFPANGVRKVRDTYTVHLGSQIAGPGPGKEVNLRQTNYVFHTGSSWKGPIGRAELTAVFEHGVLPKAIRAVQLTPGQRRSISRQDWKSRRGVVYYAGPSKAEVEGNQMRFVRTDWRPRKEDDLVIYFLPTTEPAGIRTGR